MRQLLLFETAEPRNPVLPVGLFLATCATTFFAGAASWMPSMYLGSIQAVQAALLQGSAQGLTYMLAVLAILLTHEMGHFLTVLWYRIPATYPLFIPVPFNAIGTMGAVIGMNGLNTHRRQLFDLGLSGPVAGLIVALPIYWLGIAQLPAQLHGPSSTMSLNNPLIGQAILALVRPDLPSDAAIPLEQVNPLFMAGWVGMLITGLNMLPISQLDGGHVLYALFGERAHAIARRFLVLAILAMLYYQVYLWMLMLVLVIFIGTDHPPTQNDSVRIGPWRKRIDIASLAIPVLCFAPMAIEL